MNPTPLPAETPTERPAAGRDRVTAVLVWDQDPTLAAFPKTPAEGQLLVLETRAKVNALPWHRQKLTLVVSSLRHFVAERRAAGFHVEHRVADDYATGITQFTKWAKPKSMHVMAAREWAVDRRVRALPVTVHDDGGPGGHFLITRAQFAEWAGQQKGQLRMDRFYPLMRQRLGLLVDAKGKPEGGQWSFDPENRQHARGVKLPSIPWHQPDELTRKVMRWVGREGVGRWGTLESFGWPVTRSQALSWLDDFVRGRLKDFGPYEDAIRSDGQFLFHSLLSVPLNLGLLRPDEVARAAVEAWERGAVSLASAEGFVRQVIGWREFIRGVYWKLMPGLRTANLLEARRPLPDLFWNPQATDLQCLREAVGSVRETAYTHHINRLMIIGNYATMTGLDPRAVSHWFWAAFADAYEWVELPNVVGMALFGTDAFTTRPYLASAAYVKRMSGLSAKGRGPVAAKQEAPCARCRFDPDQRTGPDACPLNSLYWNFLDQHRARLERNVRMRPIVRGLDRFPPDELAAIRRTAKQHVDQLESTTTWTFDEDAG